ncbi:MAG: hypothetical protein QOD75_3067 [Blastocatellia bacterium]|nr:hypothetical protein [Blastocatellia bacterium]
MGAPFFVCAERRRGATTAARSHNEGGGHGVPPLQRPAHLPGLDRLERMN